MFKLNTEKHKIPTRDGRGGPVYHFAEMEVGDSFDAPRDMGAAGNGADKRQRAIGASAASFSRYHHNGERKCSVRLIDENTVRCWRVK